MSAAEKDATLSTQTGASGSAEKDAAPSWMSAEATALYERAEALAEQRGCVIENDCWIDCIDAAIEEVSSVTPPGEWDDCGHHPEWSSKNECRHPGCVTPPGEGRA